MDDGRWDDLLAPFLRRVVVRPGNGLSRDMNRCIRSYPRLPEIIRRTAVWLLEAEEVFGFDGVFIRTSLLRRDVPLAHADWCRDMAVVGPGSISFEERTTVTNQEFYAAMTIARRIGLLQGHGRLGLGSRVRQQAKGRITQHGMV